MKKYLLIPLILLVSINAQSDVVTKEGYIDTLLVDSEFSSDPGTWLKLDNLTSAGDCYLSWDGLVPLYIENNEQGSRQYAIALAAIASNKKVLVRVDSSVKHPTKSDSCMLKYIALQI